MGEVEGLKAKFNGVKLVPPTALKKIAKVKPKPKIAKIVEEGSVPILSTKKGPKFFQGGDDGSAPIKKKQK